MSDFDVTICTVTREQYMAMLNEFRTINPNLRDRVDDPPVEDGRQGSLAVQPLNPRSYFSD